MRKIKAFCGIFLVIASMTVFSLVPEVTKAYAQTSEDIEFIDWMAEKNDKLLDKPELIADEIDKGVDCDWEFVKTLCELLYVHAENALNEIDEFEVSSELKPVKKEYELLLIDMKWAAYYGKESAGDYLSGDIEGARYNFKKYREHIESAAVHYEKYIALIKHYYQHKATTQTSRSLDAIFAISSLLAVAYMVLRRRRIE